MTPTVRSTRLSSTRHRELLRRCAEDDAFRAELQRDAVATLARYGVALDADALPARVTLPAKHELRQALGTSGADIGIPWMGLVGPASGADIGIPWMGLVGSASAVAQDTAVR